MTISIIAKKKEEGFGKESSWLRMIKGDSKFEEAHMVEVK